MPIKLKKSDIENMNVPQGHKILGFDLSGTLVSKDSNGVYEPIIKNESTGYFTSLDVEYLTIGERLYLSTIGSYSIGQGTNIVASGLSSFAQGEDAIAEGDYSRSRGKYVLASGYNSYVSGQGKISTDPLTAAGDYSFVHSFANDSSGTLADYSVILGGINHNIGSDSNNSVILGGDRNDIWTSVQNTAIIVGSNITAQLSDTVYVPRLVLTDSSSFEPSETDGTIEFDGTNFRGYKNGGWVPLDSSPAIGTVTYISPIAANEFAIWNNNAGVLKSVAGVSYASNELNVTGKIRPSTSIENVFGSESNPSYSFYQANNNGMYRSANNEIGFATQGTLRVKINNTGLEIINNLDVNTNTTIGGTLGVTGAVTMANRLDVGGVVTMANTLDVSGVIHSSGSIKNEYGTYNLPSYTFWGADQSGMYYGSNVIGISIGGVNKLSISTNGINTITGSAALPSYSFAGNTTTGLYHSGGINFSVSGTKIGKIATDGLTINKGNIEVDNSLNASASSFLVLKTDGGGLPVIKLSRNENPTTIIAQNGSQFQICFNPGTDDYLVYGNKKNIYMDSTIVGIKGHSGTSGNAVEIKGGYNTGSGKGGDLTISGGISEFGVGGDVNINGGDSGNPLTDGQVNITSLVTKINSGIRYKTSHYFIAATENISLGREEHMVFVSVTGGAGNPKVTLYQPDPTLDEGSTITIYCTPASVENIDIKNINDAALVTIEPGYMRTFIFHYESLINQRRWYWTEDIAVGRGNSQ